MLPLNLLKLFKETIESCWLEVNANGCTLC